jgi:hypothetical protein
MIGETGRRVGVGVVEWWSGGVPGGSDHDQSMIAPQTEEEKSYADTPTRRYADTPTRRHADTPTRRYADTPTRFPYGRDPVAEHDSQASKADWSSADRTGLLR